MLRTEAFPGGYPFRKTSSSSTVTRRVRATLPGMASWRVVAWMYLFKNYDLKDWVSFCEVYGMPLRLGTYDATASEKDKAA